jgi:centrin-2/centrin-1
MATSPTKSAGRPTKSRKEQAHRLHVELSPQQRGELRQAFDLFDTEGTGRIQAQEIKVALRALGFEVKKDELKALLAEVGTAPSGSMDFNEFLRIILMKVGEKESKEEVQRAFMLFDETDKGHISFEDLKQISKTLGQDLTDDELKEMMDFAHPRGRVKETAGREAAAASITEEDFMRLMKRANVY